LVVPARLESVFPARERGFKSLPLRHQAGGGRDTSTCHIWGVMMEIVTIDFLMVVCVNFCYLFFK
jgi:hypothetical protein